jgi:hypothetical protein
MPMHDNASDPFIFVAYALVILVVIGVLRSARARKKQFQQLAESAELTFIGDALPRYFPLEDTSLPPFRSIRHAVAGSRKGTEVLIFDFTTGRPKKRRSGRRCSPSAARPNPPDTALASRASTPPIGS